jgi:hypothetical protein
MGSLEKLGAVNVTDAEALPAVAAPIVGALGAPFVEPCAPRIGIVVSYLMNQQLTIVKNRV